jgi:hypothetical protein
LLGNLPPTQAHLDGIAKGEIHEDTYISNSDIDPASSS